jgi:hypothetical protein
MGHKRITGQREKDWIFVGWDTRSNGWDCVFFFFRFLLHTTGRIHDLSNQTAYEKCGPS